MQDLTMTNVFLGILAVVSLIEFLMIAAAGFLAFRAYKQVMAVVENVERDHIAPLRARVDAILDEVEHITGKVKHAQDSVSSAIHTAGHVGDLVAGSVKSKVWAAYGILRGLRNIAAGMMADGKHDQPYITANN